MFCKNCGKEIDDNADVCVNCGKMVKEQAPMYKGESDELTRKGWFLAIMCCIGFVFIAGIHRFIVGKVGTGILWLLTFGLFGVGTIIDLIMILTGSFTDNHGKNIPLGL